MRILIFAAARSVGRLSTIRPLLVFAVVLAFGGGTVSAQSLSLALAKSFSPSTAPVGGVSTTTMAVTITNPNGFSVTGVAVSDTYPAGFIPDQVGAYTCSAGSAVFTGSGFALSNITLGAGASCVIPILGHATVTGAIINTTSSVTGTGVPPGAPASATLNATSPTPSVPTLSNWGLMVLGVLIVGAAFRMLPRRSQA